MTALRKLPYNYYYVSKKWATPQRSPIGKCLCLFLPKKDRASTVIYYNLQCKWVCHQQ